MTKKMLIDALHPEEIRLAVLDRQRVEVFESETAQQIQNNIYLAKITRVEPSLQAAFVEYGGNRQGFLTFNDIHPDYFQIPQADREALIAENAPARKDDSEGGDISHMDVEDGMFYPLLNGGEEAEPYKTPPREEPRQPDSRARAKALRHNYKIQDVIKPHSKPILIQVLKEERGSKGAALTTYISLAGRYCVLMPTMEGAGGISRKVPMGARAHLREILGKLQVPEKMSLIVRTAGMKRTYQEIARDFDYLLRLWENIRERTLESTAPALIYEEGNLVHRSLRDMYDQSIGEIWIEGRQAFQEAERFMKLLMPGHSAALREHTDPVPLLHKHGAEKQIASLLSPKVNLKSGGYLVINQTEALVAIDVNSGRATAERNLEDTALKTNMEAAEEAARQLQMRDLGGLIVVDFIDMEVSRNVREVERALRDHLRKDRARIQMGRISDFGLLEMSRQRLRPGLSEGRTEPCPHCEGSGRTLSPHQAGLRAMRAIEAEAVRVKRGGNRGTKGAPPSNLLVKLDQMSAMTILNVKRDWLREAERRHGLHIQIAIGDSVSDSAEILPAPAQGRAPRRRAADEVVRIETAYAQMENTHDESQGAAVPPYSESQEKDEGLEQGSSQRQPRRRRRGGRGRHGRGRFPAASSSSGADRGQSPAQDQEEMEEQPWWKKWV